VHGSCAVSFEGSSTLHGFSGTLPPIDFEVRPAPDSPSGKETWSVDLEAPVAAMHTGNDRRDRNMREMLDASAFPNIKAKLHRIDPEMLRGSGEDEAEARPPIAFELTIRDVTHPLHGNVSNWREDIDQASFDLDFDVSLAHFGLKAPTTLLFIRVEDRVAVHVAVSIRRE
jgi:polyisoprenoid-binding protein YceI